MIRYCEQCRAFHEENDLCPKYKEQLKQHPEWFNEMMQTMVTSTISTSTVQRYGAAIKEHLVAYDGVDYERGTVASRSLKSVAQSKVNPNDSARNIKQQAGFSAEIKSVARANAERIINGDDTTRTIRTDDMTGQSDGHGGSIGGTNDQFYDLAEVDKNGVYIEGSGRQLKFVGNDAESCTKSLLQRDYDKYREHGVALEVPSDFYDEIIKDLDSRADKLKSQIDVAERKGDSNTASKYIATPIAATAPTTPGGNSITAIEQVTNEPFTASLPNARAISAFVSSPFLYLIKLVTADLVIP